MPPEALPWGTVVHNGCSPCGTSIEDSLKIDRLLCSPRLGEGACDTVSALGHTRFSTVLDGPKPPAGKGV